MFKFLNVILVVSLVLIMACSAGAQTVLFSDDFNSSLVQAPWVVDSGAVSADASNPPAGFLRPVSGTLMLSPDSVSAIHVGFGTTTTPVEADFKIYQSNACMGSYWHCEFGFTDAGSGNSYKELANMNSACYGPSGFMSYSTNGDFVGGAPGYSLTNSWNYMKLIFDPSSGVQVWEALSSSSNLAYSDPSLTYAKVASWSNFKNLTSVNQFYMNNGDGVVSFNVDDVQILGGTPVPEPGSLLAIGSGFLMLLGIRRKRI